MAYVMAGVVVVAVVVAMVVVFRRRARTSADAGADITPQPPAPPEIQPMTGLEAALAQVTDREGRPIGERIEAEAPLVDELRVPDDTGPVLRRALDRVEHQPDDEPDGSSGDRPDSADHAERDDLQPDPRPDHDHDRHHDRHHDHGAS